MQTFSLSDYCSFFKGICCETVISDRHKFWFRYRIGYVLIPLFYLVTITSPYVATITLYNTDHNMTTCIIFKEPDAIRDIVFFMPFYILEDILILSMAIQVPFIYYMDLLEDKVKDDDVTEYDRTLWITKYRIVATLLANIIPIVTNIYFRPCRFLFVSIPTIVLFSMWILLGIYCLLGCIHSEVHKEMGKYFNRPVVLKNETEEMTEEMTEEITEEMTEEITE
jgi:hypothetical protein